MCSLAQKRERGERQFIFKKKKKKKHRSINICHWPQHQKHNYHTKLADNNFQCAKLYKILLNLTLFWNDAKMPPTVHSLPCLCFGLISPVYEFLSIRQINETTKSLRLTLEFSVMLTCLRPLVSYVTHANINWNEKKNHLFKYIYLCNKN